MRTPAALEVIAYFKILLLRYRLRVQLPKNPSSRNLDSKIQSQSMRRPPLRLAPINQDRPPAKIKKKSILRRNGMGKTLLQL